MKRLRDLAVDGLLLALPLGAAAFLLHHAIRLLVEVLAPIAHLLPPGHWFGVAALEIVAFVVLVLVLIVLGAFSRSAAGRRVAAYLEDVVLSKVPGYLIYKSIAAGFTGTEHDAGLRPALVSFDDNTVLGFVVEDADALDMVTVFIPEAPAASSGSVVLVLRERVQPLDVATGAAMRTMKQRGVGLQALPQAVAMHSSRAPAPAPLIPTPRMADVRPAN
jgi:uncharacterized membrane protein